jgi:nitrous oxide reductase accessory protein NosL
MVPVRNKKGAESVSWGNIIPLILLVLYIVIFGYFIYSQMNGAAVWEEYYAKELVKVVNLAEPGDEFWIDVHDATKVAKSNRVGSFSETFQFKKEKKEVCVKLNSAGKQSGYNFMNDVDVVDYKLNLGSGPGARNQIYFKIARRGDK